MISVHRYSSSDAPAWDEFIRQSRNGTFLFERAFMDYHSERFADHSLVCRDDKRWLAVLPANEAGDTLYSHQGLTYGGLVLAPRTTAGEVMAIMDAIAVYLRAQGFKFWYYKQVPYIYHQQPSEDDEYALWRMGASLEVCNLSTAIDFRTERSVPMEERRGRGQRRAIKMGYSLREISSAAELAMLWPIIEHNLSAHHATHPAHSAQEMQLLMERFPHNIRCWVAEHADAEGTTRIEGGVIIFECGLVAHSQYPHASEEGKQNGVMDLLFLHVINYYRQERPDVRYFDFGISNENGGRFLNEGLQAQKEGFGARGVTYRQWRIRL